MAQVEMVIFTRTYDLVKWLIPCAAKFPKLHRFTIAARLNDAILDFQETLFTANVYEGARRLSLLWEADADLQKVRCYLRLAYEWQWLTTGQYEHASTMVNEVGRLLGGWIKQTQRQK